MDVAFTTAVRKQRFDAALEALVALHVAGQPLTQDYLPFCLTQSRPPPLPLLSACFRGVPVAKKWKSFSSARDVADSKGGQPGWDLEADVEAFIYGRPEEFVKVSKELLLELFDVLDAFEAGNYLPCSNEVGLAYSNLHNMAGYTPPELAKLLLTGKGDQSVRAKRLLVLCLVFKNLFRKCFEDYPTLAEKTVELYEEAKTVVDLQPLMSELDPLTLEGVHEVASKKYFERLFSVLLSSFKVTAPKDTTIEDDDDSCIAVSNVNPNYISSYLDEVIRLVADYVTFVPYALVTDGIFDAMEELKKVWGDSQKVSSDAVDILLKVKEPFAIMSAHEEHLTGSPTDFILALEALMTALKFGDHLVNIKKGDAQCDAVKRKSLKEYGKFPENDTRLKEFVELISGVSETLKRSWLECREDKRAAREKRYAVRNPAPLSRASSKKLLRKPTSEELLWKSAVCGASDIAKIKATAEEILKDKEDVIKELEHDLKFDELELLAVQVGADFGFITDEELQSLTEHSKGEQGELKRASDKKVTDLEEEARKYKYRAEEETKKQDEERSQLVKTLERNKIKEERVFINANIEIEKARLHGERDEKAPEAERERERAKVEAEGKLAQQNLMDKVLCEELEERLTEVAASAYHTFVAVSRDATKRIATTIQAHDTILEDALSSKNAAEELVNELKDEVDILTKCYAKTETLVKEKKTAHEACGEDEYEKGRDAMKELLKAESERGDAKTAKLESEFDLEEASKAAKAAGLLYDITVDAHAKLSKRIQAFTKTQDSLEDAVKSTRAERERIKYTLDGEKASFNSGKATISEDTKKERLEEAKRLQEHLRHRDETEQVVFDELQSQLDSLTGLSLDLTIRDFNRFKGEVTKGKGKLEESLEKLDGLLADAEIKQRDATSEVDDIEDLQALIKTREEAFFQAEVTVNLRKKDLFLACKRGRNIPAVLKDTLKASELMADAEVAKIQAERDHIVAAASLDYHSDKINFMKEYRAKSEVRLQGVERFMHIAEEMIEKEKRRSQKNKANLEIEKDKIRTKEDATKAMIESKEQQAAEREEMKLEVEQMGIAEARMYTRLEEEISKFTSAKDSADFMKFLKDADPKATMQIQTARLKRDDKLKRVKEMAHGAKMDVDRLKKQTGRVDEDLKKAQDNFKLKEAASNRPQMSSERRASVTKQLLEARMALGEAESAVFTTRHELKEAERMVEHSKALEGLILKFCQSGERRAKKFNTLKASIADSMQKSHMSKELDRIREKVQKNKDRAAELLSQQREEKRKAREADEAKLKEELEIHKGDEDVFAELEKHLTENVIDDVREFVNEGEHATVRNFHRAITRQASTLSDVESEIETSRTESAKVREAHSNASKALKLAEEEVARRKETLKANKEGTNVNSRIDAMQHLLKAEEARGKAEANMVKMEEELREAIERVVHSEKKHSVAKSSINNAKRSRIEEVIEREHKRGEREIKSLREVKVGSGMELLPETGARIICDASLYRLPIRLSAVDIVDDELAMSNRFISSELVLKVNGSRVTKSTIGVVAALRTDEHGKAVLIASVKSPAAASKPGSEPYGDFYLEVWFGDLPISAVRGEAVPSQALLLPSVGLSFANATNDQGLMPSAVKITYPSGNVANVTAAVSSEGNLNFTQEIWEIPDGFISFEVECEGYCPRRLSFYKYKDLARSSAPATMKVPLAPVYEATDTAGFDKEIYSAHRFILSWGKGDLHLQVLRSDGEHVSYKSKESKKSKFSDRRGSMKLELEATKSSGAECINLLARKGMEYVVYVKTYSKDASDTLPSSLASVEHVPEVDELSSEGSRRRTFPVPEESCGDKFNYWWVCKIYDDGEIAGMDNLEQGMPIFHAGKLGA